MTKSTTIKTLEKVYKAELKDSVADLSDRQAFPLLNKGLIELKHWCEKIPMGIMSCSGYILTEKGRIMYCEWCSEQKEEGKYV